MIRLVGITTTALMILIAGRLVAAQDVQATTVFEVVSIKPTTDFSPIPMSRLDEVLFRITPQGQLVGRADLKSIIHLAYGAKQYERVVAVEPGASRFLDEQFDIRALPPPSPSPPPRDEVMAMTRHMLAERFGLTLRIDTEAVNATVLRATKPGVLGPGLRPAPEGCRPLPAGATPYNSRFDEAFQRSCTLRWVGNRLRGTATLDNFAQALSLSAQRPIIDRTDLTGMFTIDVVIAMASLGPGPPGVPPRVSLEQNDAPAFVDALRDQMGLSARRERQPIRLFVVEHMELLTAN